MTLRVTILGSGSSVPDPLRRPPAFLIETDSAKILVDCGAGTSTALAEVGVSLADLSAIFLSHLHLDHCGDLAAMLFALHNPLGPRRCADLPLYGPDGLPAMLSGLRQLYRSWVEPIGVALTTNTLQPSSVLRWSDLAIEPIAVNHGDHQAFAFRLEAAGKRVCISGDTAWGAGIEHAARDVDLLLCECGALEEERSAHHLSASEVGAIAARAKVSHLVLTHLYQHVVETDPLSRVRLHYSGPAWLAFDRMVWQAR